MLMDSSLLEVYIHIQKNVLIEVNPQTRIPRTFDCFCGLMVQLLHKLSVRAADGPQKLLNVIKIAVSDHCPVGCMKAGTSFSIPVIYWCPAVIHGKVSVEYIEKMVSISSCPLSAALTCAKHTTAFEEKVILKLTIDKDCDQIIENSLIMY
uniref:Uncharacterized protein n=1 Tax=Cebus imitator TaxID=2715852 RepID=A0A2K5S021_CEBIM